MDLPTTREGPLARKKLEKAAAILQNVLRRVVVKTGQTQRVLRHCANAAKTSRKAVYKTVLLQRAADKRAQAVEFAPIKSSLV